MRVIASLPQIVPGSASINNNGLEKPPGYAQVSRMEGSASGGADGGDAAMVKRACDQCRTRKIRCDKESPCSNCRIAQRSCSTTGLGQRPRETRQRVLISTQYEKKIDYFGTRLDGIEDLLRELTISLKSSPRSSNTSEAVLSLAHLPAQHRASSASNPRTLTPSCATTNTTTNVNDGVDDTDASSEFGDSAFEGTSSLVAHTVQASEYLEHVVERERWNNQQLGPNMQAALSSLQRMVGLQHQRKKGRMMGPLTRREVKFPNQKPMPPGGLKDLPMPPVQTVVSILRGIKDTSPVTFTLICAFIAIEDFTESCRKVYFATEDFSTATYITVNAGLYYLFQEKFLVTDENSGRASEYMVYHNMCRDNLETALANLPFFMPAKMETIEALLLGAGYAIEISKPSLAWQLNSAACNMCTSLGYHRPSPLQNPCGDSVKQSSSLPPPSVDPLSDKKQALFWFAYMLDKGLALRFGRASVLQDYDITLPRVMPATGSTIGTFPGPDTAPNPWQALLELWIKHAEIQGKTYQDLYSSSALQRTVEARVESARSLAEQLSDVIARTEKLSRAISSSEENAGFDSLKELGQASKGEASAALAVLSMVIKSDEVSHWSTLALIYRAIPPSAPGRPSRFNDECIAAARAAFATHLECLNLTASSEFLSAAYLHWTILYAPFVPFIVLFCHVIEANDKEDLRRLEEFMNSLQTFCAVSGAVDKLHRLCRIMFDVAELYVEAKGAEMHRADANMTPLGNNFDMYLSQLGLMAPLQSGFDAGDIAGAGLDSEMVNASYQAAQLGDWFEGGRHMMGLLEEDLSQFQPEPGVWSAYDGGPP